MFHINITNEGQSLTYHIVMLYFILRIKTHDSESRGQEEAQQRDH